MNPLLAGCIHDAKNGLGVLGAWLEEARRAAPSPALDEARAIASAVNAQLVELLALSRADEGTLRLAIEDHHLGDFCTEVLQDFILPPGGTQRIDAKPVLAGLHDVAAFDAYQVKMVLHEALRNALRHGGKNIHLAVAVEGKGGVRFTIGDDGPGFPRDVLEGKSLAMGSSGSGIGLAFARLIAERHTIPGGQHGRIELTNAGGAVFSLILP